MRENRGVILPLYLAVDESASMYPRIDDLNAGLAAVYDELLALPMVASKVRLTVLGFSDDVILYQRLVDIRAELAAPSFKARTTTNYSELFSYIDAVLPEDIALLRADNYDVVRPAVFMLTDGLPSDGVAWREPYTHLMQQRYRPNIVAFGIGDVLADTVLAVASRPEFAFISADGARIQSAIGSFMSALTSSVVASGRTITTDAPELVVEKPEGFISLAIDVI
jgi:uncharacterized protein YegL